MRRHVRGNKPSTFSRIFPLVLLTSTILGCIYLQRSSRAELQVQAEGVVAVAEEQSPTPTPTLTETPTPTLSPTPVVRASAPDPDTQEIEAEIKRVFGDAADEAFLVLSCENKTLNPTATNHNRDGSIDRGIFQINSVHLRGKAKGKDLFDYKQNIEVAHKIYSEQGWTPWSCAHKVGVKPFYMQ